MRILGPVSPVVKDGSFPRPRHCRQTPRRNPRPLRATTRIPAHKIGEAADKLDYRVTKMRLSKDKSSLFYNEFLTLSGIPTGNLRIPPRQPLRPRMGHRPIPGLHRQAQRHHQRPQPRRRPAIHPPPHRPSHHRQPRNRQKPLPPCRPSACQSSQVRSFITPGHCLHRIHTSPPPREVPHYCCSADVCPFGTSSTQRFPPPHKTPALSHRAVLN